MRTGELPPSARAVTIYDEKSNVWTPPQGEKRELLSLGERVGRVSGQTLNVPLPGGKELLGVFASGERYAVDVVLVEEFVAPAKDPAPPVASPGEGSADDVVVVRAPEPSAKKSPPVVFQEESGKPPVQGERASRHAFPPSLHEEPAPKEPDTDQWLMVNITPREVSKRPLETEKRPGESQPEVQQIRSSQTRLGNSPEVPRQNLPVAPENLGGRLSGKGGSGTLQAQPSQTRLSPEMRGPNNSCVNLPPQQEKLSEGSFGRPAGAPSLSREPPPQRVSEGSLGRAATEQEALLRGSVATPPGAPRAASSHERASSGGTEPYTSARNPSLVAPAPAGGGEKRASAVRSLRIKIDGGDNGGCCRSGTTLELFVVLKA